MPDPTRKRTRLRRGQTLTIEAELLPWARQDDVERLLVELNKLIVGRIEIEEVRP